jgi:pyrroloquinoline-quinone synthase
MADTYSRDEFVRRVPAIGEEKYHDRHDFHQRMHAGKLSQDELRRWIANRFYYQQSLPIKDALIVAKLPTSADRREWTARIVDQDGAAEGEGGLEGWLKLCDAAGVDRAAVIAGGSVLPGMRFATDAYVSFCREQPWPEAVASSLTQLFTTDLMRPRIEAFERHYDWIDPAGRDYFKSRIDREPHYS